MSRQEINLGATPTGIGGDTPRSANVKINAMTKELYDKNATLGTAATKNVATNSKPTVGQVMMAGDWGVSVDAFIPPAGTNFRDLTEGGNYVYTSQDLQHTGGPVDDSGYYIVHVMRGGGAYCRQNWYNYFSNVIWTRFRTGVADGWSSFVRVLTSSETGFGGPSISTNNTDANSLNPSSNMVGLYNAANLPKGAPAANILSSVWGPDPRWTTQFAMGVSNSRMFYRSYMPSVGGNSWAEIVTTASYFNPIAEGGLMETGSMINGGDVEHYWTKFANGQFLYNIVYPKGFSAGTPISISLAFTIVGNPSVSVNSLPSSAWVNAFPCFASGFMLQGNPRETANQVLMFGMMGRWR